LAARDKLVKPKKFTEKYGEHFPIWSFSRISTMENCVTEYWLSRVKKVDSEDNIYTLSGTVCHDILEGFYNGEVKYEVMNDKFESDFLDIEISDYKFSSEEYRNKNMRNKYKTCVSHFFQHHQPIQGKVKTEQTIWIDVEGNVFVGYMDYIYKDQNGKYHIGDFKTSTIFKGKDLHKKSKQLKLYAEGLHQLGVPYEDIICEFNFLKYTSITYMQKNGKEKVTHAERHKWVEAIKTPLKKDIESLYEISTWEADLKLDDCVRKNSLDDLIPTIRNKYKLTDCYVSVEVTEESIHELKQELVSVINDINSRNKDEENDWGRGIIEASDSFYCTTLCSVKRSCSYFKEYIKQFKQNQKEEEDIIIDLDGLPF
jgi:hypothetical protein